MSRESVSRIGAAQRLAQELAEATAAAVKAFTDFENKEIDRVTARHIVIGGAHALAMRGRYSGADASLKTAVDSMIADLRKLEAAIDELADWREKWAPKQPDQNRGAAPAFPRAADDDGSGEGQKPET